MRQSPAQIGLVLVAAALASVVLISFVKAEASVRQGGKVPEIPNGNLFSAAGHRVKRMIANWAPFGQWQSGDNKTTPTFGASRRLSEWIEPTHAVRHAKHRGVRATTESTSVRSGDAVMGEERWRPDNASNASSIEGSQHAKLSHDRCYDTTDVLYVIAITCVINFAFVLVIMTWVRLSTSRQAHRELTHPDWNSKRHSTTRLCPSDSYSSVQEYVNSLPDIPYMPDTTRTGSTSRYQRRTFSMEDLLFV